MPMKTLPAYRLGHLMQQKNMVFGIFAAMAQGTLRKQIVITTGEAVEEEALRGVVTWLIRDHKLHAKMIGKRSTLGIRVFAPTGKRFRVETPADAESQQTTVSII